MRIVLHPDFDQGCWPGPLRGGTAAAGEDWVGPRRLVEILETALGLGGPRLTAAERAAHLVPALGRTDGFWSASAALDPFAAARRLLDWSDTLAMGGWRAEGRAPRLAALAALAAEALPGLPARLRALHEPLARRSPGLESVELLVPRGDLEPLWQRTLGSLEGHGTRVVETALPAAAGPAGSDLAAARGPKFRPRGDGTLRLLRPDGPLAAAEEVAAWLASLGDRSGIVLVGSEPALDAALHRHGLPATGASHALRDDALLQVLPLALELGWSPPDPQRAYELLSLAAGPVPSEVRWKLRDALGEWPAVDSDDWRTALAEGLAAIEDVARRERVKQRLAVLWDARVPHGGAYPVEEVGRRVQMLRAWLVGRREQPGTDRDAWGAALGQCDGLLGLAGRSGLASFTAAQLRHLVVEATRGTGGDGPLPAQAGLAVVGAPGGVAGPARHVVWWSFDQASAPGVVRLPLTRAERAELEARGVVLPDPGRLAAAAARRWRRPLETAGESLLLVCPVKDANGDEQHPHPLWDELVARVAEENTRRFAEAHLLRTSLAGALPQSRREVMPVPEPRRDWSVPAGRIARREKESPSSVETLLGCPFRWALRYAGGLYEPDSAQLDDHTSPRLLGDLLHGIMNRLFAGPERSPAEAESEAGAIFDREGPRLAAALFLPGAADQRARVRRAAVGTARALYALMAAKGLRVLATEETRAGRAFGTTFEGRVDLVLGEPARILDLKWSGATGKRKKLASGTATQLAGYAFLECGGQGPVPPVGYFVMESQRLMSTQPDAFPHGERVEGPPPEETWRLMEETHAGEWQVVQAGRLAARGVVVEDDEKPRKDPAVVDGRIVLPPPCDWCDYAALCGRAFAEES
jgi:hypothetical protein